MLDGVGLDVIGSGLNTFVWCYWIGCLSSLSISSGGVGLDALGSGLNTLLGVVGLEDVGSALKTLLGGDGLEVSVPC